MNFLLHSRLYTSIDTSKTYLEYIVFGCDNVMQVHGAFNAPRRVLARQALAHEIPAMDTEIGAVFD